jgi:IS30 family transposase
LSKSERDEISILLEKGYSFRAIAKTLDRHQSSIVREVGRNQVKGKYQAQKAETKARVRTHQARFQFSKLRHDRLEPIITRLLKHGLSPEAVSGRLRREGLGISKNAIYHWLYSAYGQGVCQYLHSRSYAKRKRRKPKTRKLLILNRTSIHERKRLTEYDYEGDTVVSSWNTVSLVTLINPLTLYLAARKVPNLKPKTVQRAFRSMLSKVQVSSLTLDNGQENRLHGTLGIKTFFCDPYSSWQKPGIENGNRLLRRFFPKGTNLARVSIQKLASVIWYYNDLPRKKLSWETPREVMDRKKLFKNKKPPRGG